MIIPQWMENAFIKSADCFYKYYPQPLPDREHLFKCKIVSHRGAYDNQNIFENTLPAFGKIKTAGIWGIEFDVRWTKDLNPVVFHDTDMQRLFGSRLRIQDLTLAEIKASYPLIPSLKEIVDNYGKILHLMVEIKDEFYPDPDYQGQILNNIFSPLRATTDYHFLALNPKVFSLIDFAPSETFLPIAEINVSDISDVAIQNNYLGISGHYLLITDTILKTHAKRNQMIATGFVNSKNCMFRELNRGITWIFSQKAIELQSILNRLLEIKS